MGMLTKEDLGQIGTLLDEKLVKNNVVLKAEIVASEERVTSKIIETVGEMIDQNVIPALDKMGADLRKEMREGFTSVDKRIDRLIEGASDSELESLRLYPRSAA